MSFYSPQVFYWLFALLPLVLLWHFLKLRREDHFVANIELWANVAEDSRANAPFRWLRRRSSLVLQVITVLLCVTALARPTTQRVPSDTYCLILQNSASMQSIESGESRWDGAKSKIHSWLDSLDPDTQLYLIDAANTPRLYTADSPTEIRRQLDLLSVQDAPSDLDSALQLARTLGELPILLFGDHLPDSMSESPREIAFQPVTAPSKNLAITALYRIADSEIMVRVMNLSPRDTVPAEFAVNLLLGESLYESSHLTLASGEERLVQFQVPTVEQERIARIVLESDDALALDNVAYIVLHPPTPVRVQVVSAEFDPYLRALFGTASWLEAQFVPEDAYVRSNSVIVFHRVPAQDDMPRRFIEIPISNEPESTTATILRGVATHPILQGVDLDFWVGKQISKVTMNELPDTATSILGSDAGPLVSIQETPDVRSVTFAWDLFDPDASAFTRSYAGWLLMVNAIEWIREPPVPLTPVPAGEQIVLRPPPGYQSLVVQKPDGRQVTYPKGLSEVVFGETEQVGVYVFLAESWSTKFAVNLLNEHESDLNRISTSSVKPLQSVSVPTTPHALWHWFVLAAVVLLCVEWWVVHRSE